MSEQLDRALAVRREDYVVGADVTISGTDWVIMGVDWDRLYPITCRPRDGSRVAVQNFRAHGVRVAKRTWTVEEIEAFLA